MCRLTNAKRIDKEKQFQSSCQCQSKVNYLKHIKKKKINPFDGISSIQRYCGRTDLIFACKALTEQTQLLSARYRNAFGNNTNLNQKWLPLDTHEFFRSYHSYPAVN